MNQTHGHAGLSAVQQLATSLVPGLPAAFWPGKTIQQYPGAPETSMANSIFILFYLLRIGLSRAKKRQKKKAFEVLFAVTQASGGQGWDLTGVEFDFQALGRIWEQQSEYLEQKHLAWSGCLACILWCLAHFHASRRDDHKRLAEKCFLNFVTEAGSGMDAFGLKAPAPALQVMTATQQRGRKKSRRLSHVVRARVNTFKRPRLEVQEQNPESKITVDTNLVSLSNPFSPNRNYCEHHLPKNNCIQDPVAISILGGKGVSLATDRRQHANIPCVFVAYFSPTCQVTVRFYQSSTPLLLVLLLRSHPLANA